MSAKLPISTNLLNAVHGSIAGIGAVTNTYVIARFILKRRSIKRGETFLVSLALADLLSCYTIVLFMIVGVLWPSTSLTACRARGFGSVFFAGCSAWSASMMAIERYFHIVRYKSFSKLLLIALVSVSWIIPLILATVPFITGMGYPGGGSLCLPNFAGRKPGHFAFSIPVTIIVVFQVITIPLCYFLVLKHAIGAGFKWKMIVTSFGSRSFSRKTATAGTNGNDHHVNMNDSTTTFPSANNNSHSDLATKTNLNLNMSTESLPNNLTGQTYLSRPKESVVLSSGFLNQMKLTKKLLIITGVFVIGWLPVAVINAYRTIDGTEVDLIVKLFTGTLNILSWMFNGLILCFYDTRFKKFTQLWKKKQAS